MGLFSWVGSVTATEETMNEPLTPEHIAVIVRLLSFKRGKVEEIKSGKKRDKESCIVIRDLDDDSKWHRFYCDEYEFIDINDRYYPDYTFSKVFYDVEKGECFRKRFKIKR